jgi:aspartyl-tRNA(Asn)/glutamyl-tRNA(Gln) amidotransferase subunit A
MTAATLPDLRVIAGELRAGTRRCTDVVEAALTGREASSDRLGPYKTWDPDGARRQAAVVDDAFRAGMDAGPLQGIPVSFKDLFGVRGWPTFAGTARRLPACWETEGSVVSRIRSQLCVVMGKTHMVELAFGGLGTNLHWGTPRNPWDLVTHRVPGGSSSGAGVSLVEGSALLALGTDTAGSVRIPASMTGTAGLKTSVGRWPTDGVVPLSFTFDSVGLLARSVRDLAFAFEAIEGGFGRRDPVQARSLVGCRFGVPERLFRKDVSPGIEEAFAEGLRAIERAGATPVAVDLPQAEEAYAIFLQGGLAGVEVAAFLAEALPDRVAGLDPAVQDRIRSASSTPATEYLRRRKCFEGLAREAWARMAEVDALLTPTVAISPPAVADLEDLDAYRRCNLLALRNTSIGNLLSLCALSLPVGRDALGLPVGLQVMGLPGTDGGLLGLGLGLEGVLDVRQRSIH